jgi:type IV secretory pathway VirB10-like protein
MKKWMYLVFPGVMLAVFLVFYLSSKKKWEEQEAAHAAQIQAAKEADDAKKASAESAARIAAKKRSEDLKKEEDAYQKAKREKWDAESNAIKAVMDKSLADAAASTKEAASLEAEAAALRQQKDQLNGQDFDLLKKVELAQIRQRDSELEIQRTVRMIAERAGTSTMVQMPPPPPPEK